MNIKSPTPKFKMILPSSGKEINFRPFLVAEQKILLMAKESDKFEDQEIAMRDIIERCTFGEIKSDDKLTPVDIEMIFLQIRIKSKGAVARIGLQCKNHVSRPERNHPVNGLIPAYNGPCNKTNELEINLDDVIVENQSTFSNKILLSDDVGVTMKLPDVKDDTLPGDNDYDNILQFILRSIETVFDGDNLYHTDELEDGELETFVDSLTMEQFEKIVSYFNQLPYIKLDVNFKCESCGHTETKEIRGLQNLFL